MAKSAKPTEKANMKACAFKLPVLTLARLKAYAVATNRRQGEIVCEALDKHLDGAIAASGKQALVAELVKTYSGKERPG